MQQRLQQRIQRYGWDLAAPEYEALWQAQLASAQRKLMDCAALAPGELVLDVACGTGLVSLDAARAVGASGHVLGVDISGQMIETARQRAAAGKVSNVSFARMDAQKLDVPDASYDVALCALGLMYVPDPIQAASEMRRVLRPGGRVVVAVWGERARCGWSALFPIIDAEVSSEVCPLFFSLGQHDALVQLYANTNLDIVEQHRISSTLFYPSADEACKAAFVGGPVALAWSRFDDQIRARVCQRYLEEIAKWRDGHGYRVPGEFVIASAVATIG